MRALGAVAAVALVALCAGRPADADAPITGLRLVRLSDRGPAFLAYDGSADMRSERRDWPVSLIFTGRATVGRVKAGLRRVGLRRLGESRYLAYRLPGASPRIDGDRGLKSGCDANGTDLHARVYAPTASDRFEDPEVGSFVVATVHLDRADGCSTPPRVFGFSEVAEGRLAGLLARRLGWKVMADRLPLGNAEPYRRDVADGAHVWWADGRATVVVVPAGPS